MNETQEKIKGKVEELISQFNVLKDQVDEAKDWNSVPKCISNINSLWDFALNVVASVEVAVDDIATEIEGFKSADKLEAAVQIVDDAVKFKNWILEWADGWAIELMLSLMVTTLNKEFGNDWNLNWIREALDKGVNVFDYMKDMKEKAGI